MGTRIIPKLRSGSDIKIGVEFSVTIDGQYAASFEQDLRQILEDLGISERVIIE